MSDDECVDMVVSQSGREQRWNRVCWSLEKACEAEVLLVKARRCLQETCQEEFGRIVPVSCSLAPWVEKLSAQCEKDLLVSGHEDVAAPDNVTEKPTVSDLALTANQEVNAASPRPPVTPVSLRPTPPEFVSPASLPSLVNNNSPVETPKRLRKTTFSVVDDMPTELPKQSPKSAFNGYLNLSTNMRSLHSNGNLRQHQWTPISNSDLITKIKQVCRECGNIFKDDAIFCQKCGKKRPSQASEITLTFQPGPIGIVHEEDGGEVLKVSEGGQAQRQGVKIGWKLLAVGPQQCNSFGDKQFHAAQHGSSPYQVTLLKADEDLNRIMLDQAVIAATTCEDGAVSRMGSASLSTSSWTARDRARLLRQATGMHLPCSAKAIDKLRYMKVADDEAEIVDIVMAGYLDGWITLPIFHPQAKMRLIWLILGCAFMVYEACAIPYHLSFTEDISLGSLLVSCVINTYFIVDVPFTFLTGYFNTQGIAVMRLNLIAKRYARTWLAIDVVAGIPWEWFPGYDTLQTGSGLKGFRLMRLTPLLRLTKLLRLMKLKTVLDMFETFVESHHWVIVLTGVFKVTVLTFMAMHWAACAWHGIGKASDSLSWMNSLESGMNPTSKSDWYALSLYFTMTTMTTVGYGDIHPMNLQETRFSLLLLPVSSVMFAMLMGTLTDLIFSLNMHSRERAEKKYRLVRYMNWRAVPSKLTMRIRQHLLFIWDTKEGYDTYEEELKNELPPLLRAELSYHLYGRILNNQPYLAWMRDYPICTKMLATRVHLHYFGTGDHLFRQGDPNTQIFMVLTGLIWLSLGTSLHEGQDAASTTAKDHKSVRAGCCPFSACTKHRVKPEVENGTSRPHYDLRMQSFGPHEQLAIPARRVSLKREDAETASGYISEDQPKEAKSFRRCFNTQVLDVARINLRHQDKEKLRVVIRLQRLWRARKAAEVDSLKSGFLGKIRSPTPSSSPFRDKSDKSVDGATLALHRMHSHMVVGPAYFGESCLWKKFEEWEIGQTQRFTYTARCESRVEVLRLERKDVQAVIDHYSPWLPERFNIFCEAVCQELARRVELQDEGQLRPEWNNRESNNINSDPLRHVAYA